MNRSKAFFDIDRIDRRRFVKLGGAAVAGAVSANLFDARFAHAGTESAPTAESAVEQFHATLSDAQKKQICLPFDHKKRTRISANWHVSPVAVGDSVFSDEQRALIDQIVRNVTSEDGYGRLQQQMDEDSGGMDFYSVAFFGEPGSDRFQWEMTGRHLTLRADGNRQDKAAFGGPIVYGHGAGNPNNNLFHYQTKMANEVFGALDPKQAEQALLKKAPRETAVQVQGAKGQFPGIGIDQLSGDQKELVEKTLKTLLAPYRQADVDEAMAILKHSGGFDRLHMAFYQEGDLNSDRIWDIWRVEGPSLVWHFRGAPHVHAYINIAAKA